MAVASDEELLAAWQRLAQRNRWTLVDNIDALLAEARAECAALTESTSTAAQAEVAVERAYGKRLYQGLSERDDRAAEELRVRCYRMARKRGWTHEDAEDIAGEAVLRALNNLQQVRAPANMLGWTLMVFKSAQQQLIKQGRNQVPFPTDAEGEPRAMPDPQPMAEAIDDRITDADLRARLVAALPNERRRTILLRWVVLQEPPRVIAQALNVKEVYIIRNEKRRALLDLLKNEPFMQLADELAALSGIEPTQGKEQAHEP